MAITRRQFLAARRARRRRAHRAPSRSARACSALGTAHAAPPADPILVLVQLEGGNDGLNTVDPDRRRGSVAAAHALRRRAAEPRHPDARPPRHRDRSPTRKRQPRSRSTRP